MNRTRMLATDHRASVLTAVATTPGEATRTSIALDCAAEDFPRRVVWSMIHALHRQGLLGRNETGGHFITKAGLDWLTNARFDKALPCPYVKKTRKQKG